MDILCIIPLSPTGWLASHVRSRKVRYNTALSPWLDRRRSSLPQQAELKLKRLRIISVITITANSKTKMSGNHRNTSSTSSADDGGFADRVVEKLCEEGRVANASTGAVTSLLVVTDSINDASWQQNHRKWTKYESTHYTDIYGLPRSVFDRDQIAGNMPRSHVIEYKPDCNHSRCLSQTLVFVRQRPIPDAVCISKPSSFSNYCKIFRRTRRVSPEIWAPKKVDCVWVKTLVLFFSTWGPKFTKLGTRVQEWF